MLDGCAIHIEGADELRDGLTWGDDARKDSSFHRRQAALDERIAEEEIVQVFIDHVIHPVNDLTLTTVLENARFLRDLFKFAHDSPQFEQPGLLDGRAAVSMGFPAFGSRTDEFAHSFILALRDLGTLEVIPICFVDDDRIGQLHDAFLDALEVIARPCQYDEHEEIDHGADGGFRLTDADGFD